MSPCTALDTALAGLARECPQIHGAVVATAEGLILGAAGSLAGDTAAAGAAHLADEVDRCLALLSDGWCEQLLIWGGSATWSLVRLPGRCSLLVHATADCRAGALRLASGHLAREIAPILASLSPLHGKIVA